LKGARIDKPHCNTDYMLMEALKLAERTGPVEAEAAEV
jgi:hypothetical protein